jgi:hypothetical protein
MINVWYAFLVFVVNPLKWAFTHPKVLIPIAAVIVGVIAYQSCSRTTSPGNPDHTLTPQEIKAPARDVAPYVLETYSRVYYLVNFDQVSDDKVILFSWYEWQNKDWVIQYSSVGVPFDKNQQGNFRLTKR